MTMTVLCVSPKTIPNFIQWIAPMENWREKQITRFFTVAFGCMQSTLRHYSMYVHRLWNVFSSVRVSQPYFCSSKNNSNIFDFFSSVESHSSKHWTENTLCTFSFVALPIANCQLPATHSQCANHWMNYIYFALLSPFEDGDGDRFLCTFIAHTYI